MSGRRNGNRIRGPQSALTDFLAANNISAAHIRDEYERQVRETEQQANAGEGSSNAQPQQEDNDASATAAVAAADEAAERSRKRKRNEKAAIEKIKKAKKVKNSKQKKKNKKKDSDDDDDDDYEDGLGNDMYKKARPLPGQFENCEVCNKRFTVTPYSKSGPDGGLVCTPCGKELAKDSNAAAKSAHLPKKAPGRKRRQMESERLNGIAVGGAKTLQQLCIQTVAKYHEDVEELGELPEAVMLRLAAIFAKKRVLNPKTLKLFVRPDSEMVHIHDAAYLEVEDYQGIFAVAPGIKQLVIRNACQVKDEVIAYMMDKCDSLNYLQLYAANLVTNEMWHKLFQRYGKQLDTIKLTWLDAAFDDIAMKELVENCTHVRRLKFKLCRQITEASVAYISHLTHLEHLSLKLSSQVSCEILTDLVKSVGRKLRTLSLEDFLDVDDDVLATVKECCTNLSKFRLQQNDTATDAAYADLFTGWENPPLTFVDLSSTRDVDNNNPTGPEDHPIGLASEGFKALMAHSGPSLRTLDIASCRHITLEAFLVVFNGATMYPKLETINLSFCSCVDTTVIAGIFRSCPSIKKVIAFGCFDITDVIVPRGIALIGVPKAQDAIEQIGGGIGVAEAVGLMVDVGA